MPHGFDPDAESPPLAGRTMTPGLLRSTALVSALTLLSRVLGFLRDMVIARYFGAEAATDAFFVANRVPNLLRRLFAEGAFSQAFVPVLTEYRTRETEAATRELIDRVAGTLGVVLLGVTAVGMISAPLLVLAFAPGWMDQPEQRVLAGDMLRITFPYILFISLTALAGSILNTYGRFGVPAFTPVFLNLSIIAAAIWLAPHLERPITALAWAVLIAGVVQLAFQLPFLRRLKRLPRPRWGWRHGGVRRVMGLMLPAIFGSSVAQINILFDTLIASFLAVGSVSWLFYADRLLEFPLGIFGIALGTVILPSLSRRHAENAPEAFSQTLDWALRWVMVIGVPAAAGLLLLSEPILTTLFQYGEFTPRDARMAAWALMAYSLGLLGFMLVKVLTPGYYARQDTRTPVRIAVIAMVSNMVLNIAFVVPMVQLGFQAPHVGLAVATALASFINAGLLWRGLRRSGVWIPSAGWTLLLLRVALACAAMVVVLVLLGAPAAQWSSWAAADRVLQLAVSIIAAVVAYFAVLWMVGVRPTFLRRPRHG